METQTAVTHRNDTQSVSIFDNADRFVHYQRVAKAFADSELVPQQFRGNIPNTLIALDMADRLKANPMAIMQSIYVVNGKPSWAATFIIAMINAGGKFSPLRFDIKGTGDAKNCVAWAKELSSNERVEGPEVSIAMAKAEGWYDKNGSKWKTMPDLMLRYRAATFFGRLYCPELLLGMKTDDEVREIIDVKAESVETAKEYALKPRFEAPAETPAIPVEKPPQAPAATEQVKPSVKAEKAPEQPAVNAGEQTPQAQLAEFVISNGITFDDFRDWLKNTGRAASAKINDVDSLGGFDDVPSVICEELRKDAKALAKLITLYGAK